MLYPSLRRTVDVVASAGALAVSAPAMLLVALGIRATMGPPVLFRQTRIGLDEKPFTIFKFRTMRDAHDGSGRLLPDAQRLTPLGELLRKTSLDELPQLFNVLRGDMSLIGPRPLLTEYLPYYTARERLRHTVRPGVTGLAQVSGRNLLSWDERLEFDARYVERRSASLDAWILLKTVFKVLGRADVLTVPGSRLGTLVQHRTRAVAALQEVQA
ncbi:sugar transferase [Pyxidicoccus caerfyrddinensis]|uniref:sugar transferase n=1 Tax=Pyxidicoccus caerfyrddinensis TaxID=2709663 RepID=UPI0013D8EB6B|nr:sugar transferase [Pyxidicoccus caerfyrddinensis]